MSVWKYFKLAALQSFFFSSDKAELDRCCEAQKRLANYFILLYFMLFLFQVQCLSEITMIFIGVKQIVFLVFSGFAGFLGIR